MQVAVEEGKDHVKDEEHIDGGLELRQLDVDAVGDPVQRGPALGEPAARLSGLGASRVSESRPPPPLT